MDSNPKLRAASVSPPVLIPGASDTFETLALPAPRADSGAQPKGLSTSPVEIGEVVNGKYRIEGIIGEGGVGIVVSAQHLELDERVALKFLKASAFNDPGLVGRFAREAKAAVSIKSEHVARILDVGTLDRRGPNDGVPFIVMEYLDGADLRTALQLYGEFSVSDTAEYGLHACEALAMAHANGIVHRDIKPDNLFLTANPQMPGIKSIKVLDFGISKAALTGSVFRQSMPLVETMHLMGTPLYMSPEQIRTTSDADARSDVWSLGMVMYEMLTGSTAFKGASLTELCAAILERPVEPIAVRRPTIPAEFCRAVERCLEKNPEDRFQNVAELAQALLPFAPKRARSCAERAVSVLRACGIARSDLRIQSTAPPPMDTQRVSLEGIAPTLGFATDTGSVQLPQSHTSWRTVAIAAVAVVGLLVGGSLVLKQASPAPSQARSARETMVPTPRQETNPVTHVSDAPSLPPPTGGTLPASSPPQVATNTAPNPPVPPVATPAPLPLPPPVLPSPAARGGKAKVKGARPGSGSHDDDPDLGY
jgi:serine/threonine-protein kinase